MPIFGQFDSDIQAKCHDWLYILSYITVKYTQSCSRYPMRVYDTQRRGREKAECAIGIEDLERDNDAIMIGMTARYDEVIGPLREAYEGGAAWRDGESRDTG